MLIRIVIVGEEAAALLPREVLPIEDVVVEERDAEGFWSEPGAEPFDLALVAGGDLPEALTASFERIRALAFSPEIVVVGADSGRHDPVGLQAAGCFAILPATLGGAELADVLATLIRRRREAVLLALRARQAPRHLHIDDFVSASPATQRVLTMARRVAVSDTSLLLLGETGAGKEWLARAVHAESPRADGPFVAVNCGALPESLLESELFGHEKGAFTGAVRARRGCFELAHRGTLFLDEIGEMTPALQVRLLRALEERTIQRLGGEHPIDVDTRIIAATHRDPRKAIETGKFREDLYYRLAVVTLTMPPLRERREDVPALAELFLRKYAGKLARPEIAGFSEPARAALLAYGWPGNVRELINVIERAVLLCDSREIGLADLPMDVAAAAGAVIPSPAGSFLDLDTWLDQPLEAGRLAVVADFERRYLASLLERNHGNLGDTAAKAGIDPRTLYNKMRQLGLRKEDFRTG